jgi:histidinol phosphatase-like enzyme (inositol monophosphatase family)
MDTNKDFLNFALKLSDESRAIIKSFAGKPPEDKPFSGQAVDFQTKSDQSPVTIVDKAIELKLKEMIKQLYPDHGFWGEETESSELTAPYVWVIDPIDGTKAFITGLPVYGTLISLTHNGLPILGVMDFPATSERLWGLAGEPSLYQGSPCRTKASGREKVMAVSNPEAFSPKETEALRAVRQEMSWAVYGGSSYVYGQLAGGRLDLAMDCGLDPYDYLALAVVISGAGGVMTDWEGEKLTLNSGHRVLAAGDPATHEIALKVISRTFK